MPERWLHELRKLQHLEPPDGLWERAAFLVKDGGDPARRLRPKGAGSRRMWSAIAAAAAIALVAAAAVLVRSAAGTGQPSVAVHGGVYKDPRFGWTIRYRAGFLIEHFSAEFRWSLDSVRVTNFTPDLRHPTGGEPDMGWLRSFPATGVAAQIWYLGGPGRPPARSSRFPLRASSFSRVRPYVGGSEPAPAYRPFTADGYPFVAAVWTGRDASPADRWAIWSVIRSLRFPHLRQGTIWHDSVYVLGRARDYPAGSVTAFPASSLPTGPRLRHSHGFYLVHASRAFYVIDQRFRSPAPPAQTCSVAFDRATSQFYCPGTNLRWNLVGRQVSPRAAPSHARDLFPRFAAVSTDGHVLFGPSWGSF